MSWALRNLYIIYHEIALKVAKSMQTESQRCNDEI